MTSVPPEPARRYSRGTSWSVRFMDRFATALISVGGVFVIGAVLLVCVFLAIVAIPLFTGSDLGEAKVHAVGVRTSDIAAIRSDEHGLLMYVLSEGGELALVRADTGETIATQRPFGEAAPSAMMVSIKGGGVIAAFPDGTIRQGTMLFRGRIIEPSEAPPSAAKLQAGEVSAADGRVYQRLRDGLRAIELDVKLADPVQAAQGPIALIDATSTSNGHVVVALTESGTLVTKSVTSRTNLMTGEVTQRLTGGETPIEFPEGKGLPWKLMLSGLGDSAYLVWRDGTVQRYDTRDVRRASLVEMRDVVEDPGAEATAVEFLLGQSSLLVGDSSGRVGVWFRIRPTDAGTADGSKMVQGRVLGGSGSPVSAIGASPRSRLVAIAHADGGLEVRHATSGKTLGKTRLEGGGVQALSIAPKEGAVLAAGRERVAIWSLKSRHPEVSTRTIAGKVWYEGYPEPAHVWQSSSGTDDFEEKFGLVPLVFGTIKGTVYCMLFGLPIAMLAAIYTSEFLPRRTRATVKPMIEMMASLPSVVLGFLAALVFAPFVERVVPGVLAAILLVPASLVLGASLWQLLPRATAIRHASRRPAAMGVMAGLGVIAAAITGPAIERLAFGGDLKAWLTGTVGGAAPGWAVLLTPMCVGVGLLLKSRVLERLARAGERPMGRRAVAIADLAMFVAIAGAGLCVAYLAGLGLAGVGLDIRGSVVGTYVQRNALIVGFVMGFAVIPIIYTVAEDALSAVPEHLRAASLGAGATPWQTAWRVIVPTAMSGLFSATMIGFGRAVGETMIVLMAAGNTSIIDWNIFNGFRTLSANIAVELPEAVQGSTHYRMLFLAALVLFVMTFVINTVAEIIRQRFRKRAFQL